MNNLGEISIDSELTQQTTVISRQESRSSNSILDVPLDPEAASSHFAGYSTAFLIRYTNFGEQLRRKKHNVISES